MQTSGGKCVAILMGLWCALAGTAQSASIQALSDTAGTKFLGSATAISADGSTVIGQIGTVAYRWTNSTKLVQIPFLPNSEELGNWAKAVNANGSVIVGWDYIAFGPSPGPAVFLSTNGVMSQLPRRTGGGTFEPTGISADGKTIVGGEGPAYSWTQRNGYRDIKANVDDQAVITTATGVSANGLVIVGTGNRQEAYEFFPFRSLGIPGDSYAAGVSGDGEVIFGYKNEGEAGGFAEQAFRWTEAGGTQGLGDLPGGNVYSHALAANFDGSIIVGYGQVDGFAYRATIWTAATGMVDLKSYFLARGITGLSNWTLNEATGISADGKTFVGNGSNGAGAGAWMVTVPEPSTYALAAVGMVALLAIKRRKSQA